MKEVKFFPQVTFLIYMYAVSLFAQGPGSAAMPFLLIGPSPGLGSFMAANVVLPSDDSFGFYYNPAQLGIFSREYNFAAQVYPEKIHWLPQFNFNDLTLNSRSFAFGKKFSDPDFTVGIGYLRTYLNLGTSQRRDENNILLGEFHSREYYDAWSIGLSLRRYALYSFGLTYKDITSQLSPVSGSSNAVAHAHAADFGFMVSVPLTGPVPDDLNTEKTDFEANMHFGYAMQNIGGPVIYMDDFQKDPLPRTAQLGLGLSGKVFHNFNFGTLDIAEIMYAHETNDLLIERDSVRISYQTLTGDINLFDNLLAGKSGYLVRFQRTLKINLAETVYIGLHGMKGAGFPSLVKCRSYIFSTKGFFKLLAGEEKDEIISLILDHLEIRYSRAAIKTEGPLNDTVYRGLSLHLKGVF